MRTETFKTIELYELQGELLPAAYCVQDKRLHVFNKKAGEEDRTDVFCPYESPSETDVEIVSSDAIIWITVVVEV